MARQDHSETVIAGSTAATTAVATQATEMADPLTTTTPSQTYARFAAISQQINDATGIKVSVMRINTIFNTVTHELGQEGRYCTMKDALTLTELSTKFSITVGKLDRFYDQCDALDASEKAQAEAKKKFMAEAMLALAAVATGPAAGIADKALNLVASKVAGVFLDAVSAAKELTAAARTYEKASIPSGGTSLADASSALADNLAREFIQFISQAIGDKLNTLLSDESMTQFIIQAIDNAKATYPEVDDKEFQDELPDLIQSEVQQRIDCEMEAFRANLEAAYRSNGSLLPSNAELAKAAVGALSHRRVALKHTAPYSGAPEMRGRRYQASHECFTNARGGSQLTGQFLKVFIGGEDSRKSSNTSSPLAIQIHGWPAEKSNSQHLALAKAFPGVNKKMFRFGEGFGHGGASHKRKNMLIALKIFHHVVGTTPFHMQSLKKRIHATGELLKVALCTPEFNKNIGDGFGQKVNPLGWLLLNTELGYELVHDIPAKVLQSLIDDAKALTHSARVRDAYGRNPQAKRATIEALTTNIGFLAPPAGAFRALTAHSPRPVSPTAVKTM